MYSYSHLSAFLTVEFKQELTMQAVASKPFELQANAHADGAFSQALCWLPSFCKWQER